MNKQELDDLRDFATKASKMLHNRCATGCLELLDLHAAQVAECERLREALAFYAAEGNYIDDQVDVGIGGINIPNTNPIAQDYGNIAREALKEKA